MPDRPQRAGNLSQAGGFFILLAGAVSAYFYYPSGSLLGWVPLSAGSIILGAAIIHAGTRLKRDPKSKLTWGALVFILAFASAVFLIVLYSIMFFFFVFVGPLMALVGGASGFFWENPTYPITPGSISWLPASIPRPRTLSIICLLGGIIPSIFEFFAFMFGGGLFPKAIPALAGLVTVASATLLYVQPQYRKLWGFLIIAMSIPSLLNPVWLWIVSLTPLIGGVVALRWNPHPRIKSSTDHMQVSTESAWQWSGRKSQAVFFILLILLPFIVQYPGVIPMQRFWTQTLTLTVGQLMEVKGPVRAESFQILGTIRVHGCCSNSTDDLYFSVFDVNGWDFEWKTGGLVHESLSFNATAQNVAYYQLDNRFNPSSTS